MNQLNENLLIHQFIKIDKNFMLLKSILLTFFGTLFLAVMSQLTIPLPLVPITGQTFAVILIAMVYGKKLGLTTMTSYITLGLLGFPVFANAKSGLFLLNPSGGYIIGFLFTILIVGHLSDKGWTKSYGKLFLLLLISWTTIYFFGLIHLSLFVKNNLLEIGLYPFILAEIIKSLTVLFTLPIAWKFFKK